MPWVALLVDADDAIAGLLEEARRSRASRSGCSSICLGRALHRDADIGLGDRPAVVVERDARRHLGRVDAEDIAGGAVQPDMTEVARLIDAVLVVEEQPHAVGGVIALGLDLLVGDEGDVGIGVAKQRDQLARPWRR